MSFGVRVDEFQTGVFDVFGCRWRARQVFARNLEVETTSESRKIE